MRGRLGLFIGFGAGYVLGAKAGRERYEQLTRLYDNLLSTPAVRGAKSKARDLASESVSKVTETVREKRSASDHPSGLSVAPPPSS